jgi:arsenate reductase
MNLKRQSIANQFVPSLKEYMEARIAEFGEIAEVRQFELEAVSAFIRRHIDAPTSARLVFICTHNSRRSQLSQVWAHVAALYYGIQNVQTYSGGTEVTAFNIRAVDALKRSGLLIEATATDSGNPHYLIKPSESQPAIECFSKTFDSQPNPTESYCAIMNCSHADESCPVIVGADLRIAIRYEDPKLADDTPEETMRYDNRCRQICREMLYMMSQV